MAIIIAGSARGIVAFAAMERRRAGRHRVVAPYAFGGGYLLAWIGYSGAATVGQRGLHALALLSPAMQLDDPRLAGGLLVAAGVFQWTPLKAACLRYCRSPVGLIAGGWREGPGAALRLGLHQGLYCIGCCWALMLLMFVFGVMSVLWMALITAVIVAEKVAGDRMVWIRALGVLLVSAGTWLVLPP